MSKGLIGSHLCRKVLCSHTRNEKSPFRVPGIVLATHRKINVDANLLVNISWRNNTSTALPNNITEFITLINHRYINIYFYLLVLFMFLLTTINFKCHNLLGLGSNYLLYAYWLWERKIYIHIFLLPSWQKNWEAENVY